MAIMTEIIKLISIKSKMIDNQSTQCSTVQTPGMVLCSTVLVNTVGKTLNFHYENFMEYE